jgi:hypothetical protein
MSNKNTPSPVVKETAPEVAKPEATVTVVESNNEFKVEDNTEAEAPVEAAVEAIEVPLMDGFVQVNYV